MPTGIRVLTQVVCFLFPWPIRRWILQKTQGYKIHPSARIGLSIVLADEAVLEAKAYIGHLNYIGRLDRLVLREEAMIVRYNWIPGLSTRDPTPFFASKKNRKSELTLGKGALVMNWHLIDCTDSVSFGDFSGLGGFRSKILTHGVDIVRSKLDCAPVVIGSRTMVASGSTVMKGVTIASCCVVSVDSVVVTSVDEPYSMVSGNPARFVRKLPPAAKFFSRTDATIY